MWHIAKQRGTFYRISQGLMFICARPYVHLCSNVPPSVAYRMPSNQSEVPPIACHLYHLYRVPCCHCARHLLSQMDVTPWIADGMALSVLLGVAIAQSCLAHAPSLMPPPFPHRPSHTCMAVILTRRQTRQRTLSPAATASLQPLFISKTPLVSLSLPPPPLRPETRMLPPPPSLSVTHTKCICLNVRICLNGMCPA